MKRIFAWFLAFSLALAAVPACAAPTRDPVRQDVVIEPGMQMLAETVLGAAVFTGTAGLEENAAPSQALVEAAFALGLYNLSLPHDGGDLMDGRPTMTAEETQADYPLLFVSGAYSLPASAAMAGVSRTQAGMTFDLTQLEDAPKIGVYLYSVSVSGGERVEVAADLFTYYGDMGAEAEELPEDALTWLCHADMTLLRAPETAYGYRVISFGLSERYEAGMLDEWQTVENAACEYSVNLPPIFGLADDTAAHMLWQTADGSAMIRIDVEEKTAGITQLLQSWQGSHPGRSVSRELDFDTYYSRGDSDYQLWTTSDELNTVYHVTLQFPAERQDEYALYSEFIRNSLIVWGISNG